MNKAMTRKMTLWRTAWHEGMGEIFTHWFRTLLTMIGIVMSVSALVGMVALNEGMARGKRENALQTGELTKIIIRPGESRAGASVKGLFSRGLVAEDAFTLMHSIPSLEWIAPIINYNREKATFGNRFSTPRVIGGTPEVAVMDRYLPPQGRFITALDLEMRARVCVLGATVAKQLFDRPETEALGKKIVIRGVSFLVVGVLPEHISESERRQRERGVFEAQAQRRKALKSSSKWNNYDPFWWKNAMIIIPLTTAQATFNSSNVGANGIDQGQLINISEIQAGFSAATPRDVIAGDVRRVLLGSHQGVDDFQVLPPDSGVEQVEQEIRSNRTTGGVIAGISLLVGGLGIVNIMLASIADRTREIGIRRALGATGKDIFRQVLVESLGIALLGGFLGIGGAILLLRALDVLSPPTNAPVLSWSMVAFGVASAGMIGIAAGLYPAFKASSLNPTAALASE